MKIFIKHMYLAMYFGQYLGLRVIGLYIYIYIYIAKIFYSTRQNETIFSIILTTLFWGVGSTKWKGERVIEIFINGFLSLGSSLG